MYHPTVTQNCQEVYESVLKIVQAFSWRKKKSAPKYPWPIPSSSPYTHYFSRWLYIRQSCEAVHHIWWQNENNWHSKLADVLHYYQIQSLWVVKWGIEWGIGGEVTLIICFKPLGVSRVSKFITQSTTASGNASFISVLSFEDSQESIISFDINKPFTMMKLKLPSY